MDDIGDCTIREHAGLDKVVYKLGLNQSLLPDPELGQDVAFLAFVIGKLEERLKKVHAIVDKFVCTCTHGPEQCAACGECVLCNVRDAINPNDHGIPA